MPQMNKGGKFIKYKGRSYAWIEISQDGKIVLTDEMMTFLNLDAQMQLLSIRSSNIAFMSVMESRTES